MTPRPLRLMLSAMSVSLFLGAAGTAMARDVTIPAQQLKDKKRKPRLWILAVGASSFTDSFWPDLEWPRRDARQVAKRFGRGTRFQKKKIVHLGPNATLEKTRNALNRIRRKARPKDAVVVYISTHGTLSRSAQGKMERTLVFHKSRHDDLAKTALSHGELRARLEKIHASRKLLVLATCHSGVGKSKIPADIKALLAQQKGPAAPLEQVSQGTLILSAASYRETARESDKLRGDVYTHFLLKGLDVHDMNGDGMVSALEAHTYATKRAYRFTNGRQRPTLEGRFIGDLGLPLRGRKKSRGSPVLRAFDERYKDLEIAIDGKTKGKLPLAFPLNEGRSDVRVLAPGSKRLLGAYSVDASAGETVTLEEILSPPPFSVSAGLSARTWHAERFAKATGATRQNSGYVKAAWRYGPWSVGASFAPGRGMESAILPGIDSKFLAHRYRIQTAYVFEPLSDLEVFTGISAGREHATLVLIDQKTSDRIEEKSRTWRWGGQISTTYPLGPVYGVASASHSFGDYDFGRFGSLEADSTTLKLGVQYRFGGRARRIE